MLECCYSNGSQPVMSHMGQRALKQNAMGKHVLPEAGACELSTGREKGQVLGENHANNIKEAE